MQIRKHIEYSQYAVNKGTGFIRPRNGELLVNCFTSSRLWETCLYPLKFLLMVLGVDLLDGNTGIRNFQPQF